MKKSQRLEIRAANKQLSWLVGGMIGLVIIVFGGVIVWSLIVRSGG